MTALSNDLELQLKGDALVCSQKDIDELKSSISRHGFGSLAGALAPAALRTLQEESATLLLDAKRAEQSEGLAYRASLTRMGPNGQAFFRGKAFGALLRDLFEESFELSETVSCITRYGEADHLGAHLDQPAELCAVTIILYLDVCGQGWPLSDTGLVLRVYGESMPADGEASLLIPTRTGAMAIGRGSRVWHERPRLREGEAVTALTVCFKPAP